MTKQILILILSLLLFSTCISKKYPTPQNTYWGILMTCITDSSALTQEKTVRLKMENICKNKACNTFKNQSCANRPAYVDVVSFWPSNIHLNFKKKTYFIVHSPSPVDPHMDPTSREFAVRFKHDGGILNYNKKTKELTLTSIFYDWSKTYNTSYSTKDSILTLTSN